MLIINNIFTSLITKHRSKKKKEIIILNRIDLTDHPWGYSNLKLLTSWSVYFSFNFFSVKEKSQKINKKKHDNKGVGKVISTATEWFSYEIQAK